MLLSNGLWRERFGADRNIIGRDVRMDSKPYTVIGVLAPGPQDRLPADSGIGCFNADDLSSQTRLYSTSPRVYGRLSRIGRCLTWRT